MRAAALAATTALVVSGCGSSLEDDISRAKDTSLSAVSRCSAMDEVAREGEAGVATLHQLAQSKDQRIARCATTALAGITDAEAVDELLPLLADHRQDVVVSATTALGRIGDRDAVKPVERLLDSRDAIVVIASLHALQRLGDRRSAPAVERVALRPTSTTAADAEWRTARRLAVTALGILGNPSSRGTLVQILSSNRPDARMAGTALVQVFRRDVTSLLPLLQNPSNIALAYPLVDIGQRGTEDALATALMSYGDLDLAEYYLNCGSRQLEHAARTWAGIHGYTVFTQPGYGVGGQWGQGV